MLRNLSMPLPPTVRARTVTAVLGPTNTGKTHLAIERMLGHETGMIGLPLRLLAREVYTRVVERAGVDAVALITGEEKILPEHPRYWVSTVEAMPLDIEVDFLAIDEVQIAGNFDRGHIFTDRILTMRGNHETLLLGAATMRPILEQLLPGLNVVTRPRMSVLSYAGSKKITRVPNRSVVVAFSSDEVYAIAELVRRQRGGAAVVLGSLSPRTRNAQVELFQSGDVDVLVATDAIGMGLNLDVDHVAFAGDRKFDGYQYRNLTAAEIGQIAGRAGRHMRDGTFGVTSRVTSFDDELVETVENHHFPPLKMLQWRNSALDFSSLKALRASLDMIPREQGLTRALPAVDMVALEHAARDANISAIADSRERVALLWDVCQLPDYRKIAPANHYDLIAKLYSFLTQDGTLEDDWVAKQVAFADKTDGDIDTLANRIAHIRTWTFVANRPNWLTDPVHWQNVTRDIEDRLSDALHERLTQRFVDRRTSVLMRRLRENAMLEAEVTPAGEVLVEGQHVGHLQGFRFAPDSAADGPDGKALRTAATKALASEIDARAEKLGRAGDADIKLASDGAIRWNGEIVARLTAGEEVLRPTVLLLADEQLTGPARDAVQARLDLWIQTQIATLLKPLIDLRDDTGMAGLARGLAFRLVEALGILERTDVSEDVRQIDQTMRGSLRKLGVRFGAHHIYVPALLKPAPSQLIAQLWALQNGDLSMPGLSEIPQYSASGRTSIPTDPTFDKQLYRVVGFRVCGNRAVRVDILERLADIIRPLINWKRAAIATGETDPQMPDGATEDGHGFTVNVAMTSLLGCSGDDFTSILKSLGYRMETREIANPALAKASDEAAGSEKVGDEKPADEKATEEQTAETSVAADPASTEAAATEDATPEAPAEADAPAEAASEVPAEAVDTPAAETPAAETVTKATEELPATISIEVWKPGRVDRRPRHQGQRAQGNKAADAKGSQNRGQGQGEGQGKPEDGGRTEGKGRRPGGQGKPRHGKHGERNSGGKPSGRQSSGGQSSGGKQAPRSAPKPRPIDPDSPFAALAALKADLEKGKNGN